MNHILALILIPLLVFLPATPAQAFIFGGVSIKDEKEMGQKIDAMVHAHLPTVEDPEVVQYVNGILERLVKVTPPQPFTFKGTVIRHNALNAFAVPGGYVFVFTGMIMNVEREEDLAGVLAHELAHVTQRHVAQRLERAQYLTLGSLLLAVAGIALGGSSGGAIAATSLGAGQSAMLNYSRLDETEADHQGLQYLTKAGYPPMGMVGGFRVLRQKSWMSGMSIPTYLSTHPDLGDRINGLVARIQHMPREVVDRTSDNTRFQRVKTLLWARYGDAQAALQRFSKNDALSAMGRGMVLSRQNQIPKANQAFEQALALAPNDPLVLREAGTFHYRKGDLQRSEAYLQKAMQLDRKDYMASFYYARLLDETGRGREAARYYQDVLRLIPQDADVHEAYAKSLGKTGNTADAYYHMALAAIYANNKKLAERYVEQARAQFKNSHDKRKLDRLEAVYKERKEMWEGK